MKYEHSQRGWLIMSMTLLVIIGLTISYIMKLGSDPLPLSVYIILTLVFIFVLLSFYRLKIRVDHLGIHVIYGIGLIHIKINPAKITQVSIVRTPWYYGLGIRFIGKGMLYNIQGAHAVELSYLNSKGKNKIVLIGSDDVIALKDFIDKKHNVAQAL